MIIYCNVVYLVWMLLSISYALQSEFVCIDYYIKYNSLVVKIVLSNNNNNNESETMLLPVNQQLQQSVIPSVIAGKLNNSDNMCCCKVTIPEMRRNLYSNNDESIMGPHLHKYEFVISNDANYKQLITFGLAFPFRSSVHSFLYQMKVNNYIKKLTYFIIPYHDSKRENGSQGAICLGDIDLLKQSSTTHLHKYSCKVNTTLNEWNCNINDISFIDNTTNTISLLSIPNIPNTLYFNIHKEGINIPYDVFTILKETELFSLLFFKEHCRTVLNAYLYNIICYHKHNFYHLLSNSSLTFHFNNNFDISFQLQELFTCDFTGHICNSLFYTYLHSDSNKWIFGSLLLSKMNATEFNEEEGMISFYTDRQNNSNKITRIIFILKVMLYIIILNIIVLLYIKCKINIALCKNE